MATGELIRKSAKAISFVTGANDANLNKGGLHQYGTIAERNAIPLARRRRNMRVSVLEGAIEDPGTGKLIPIDYLLTGKLVGGELGTVTDTLQLNVFKRSYVDSITANKQHYVVNTGLPDYGSPSFYILASAIDPALTGYLKLDTWDGLQGEYADKNPDMPVAIDNYTRTVIDGYDPADPSQTIKPIGSREEILSSIGVQIVKHSYSGMVPENFDLLGLGDQSDVWTEVQPVGTGDSTGIYQKAGNTIDFTQVAVYNADVPATEIIAFDFAEATVGTTVLLICDGNTILPNTVLLEGSIQPGANYIYLQYISDERQLGKVHGVVSALPEADTVAPLFNSSYPAATNISGYSFTLTAQLNEAGKVYYAVVPDGAAAPSIDAIKAGTGAVAFGNFAVLANTTGTESITGLTEATPYDVYVVAEDNEALPNVQAAPTKLDISTAAFSLADVEPFIWQEARLVDTADSTEVRDTGTQKFIKRYEDKSGYNRHFEQATEANQPELLGIGDAAYLSFGTTAGTRGLRLGATPDLFKQSFEMFFYVNVDNLTTLQMLFEESPSTSNGGINVYLQTNALQVRYNHTADAAYETRASSTSVFTTVGEKVLINVEVDFEGQKIRLRKNGTLLSYGTYTGNLPVINPALTGFIEPIDLLSRTGSSLNFMGKHRGFAITRKLTDSERADVQAYFSY